MVTMQDYNEGKLTFKTFVFAFNNQCFDPKLLALNKPRISFE